ncbi:MAG: hypothetical protein [Wufeng shrew rhabdovirus 5]|nr:MAG: hypothetical protein [Wufeng shrew rhabdovirus 5]
MEGNIRKKQTTLMGDCTDKEILLGISEIIEEQLTDSPVSRCCISLLFLVVLLLLVGILSKLTITGRIKERIRKREERRRRTTEQNLTLIE